MKDRPGPVRVILSVAALCAAALAASVWAELPIARAAALPDGCVYERVSPADKNGRSIDRDLTNSMVTLAAAPAGGAVAYASLGQFADIESGAAYAQYVSRRTGHGWVTRGVSPPIKPESQIGMTPQVQMISDDFASAVVATNAPLTVDAGDLGQEPGLYLQGIGDGPFTFRLLSKPFEPLPFGPGQPFRFYYAASTPDMRHIVFTGDRRLTADGPADLTQAVYEWVDGTLRLVSVLPGEPSMPAAGPNVGPGARDTAWGSLFPGDNLLSADGRRIFFSNDGALRAPQLVQHVFGVLRDSRRRDGELHRDRVLVEPIRE